MLTIKLNYENDRGTPEPVYDAKSGLPCLWWLTASGENDCPTVNEWRAQHINEKKLTSVEIEDAVIALGERLGINDTASSEEWRKHGIVVEAQKITGFVNWPDPSLV